MKKFSKLISFIFHPSLIPTLGIILILSIDSYFKYALNDSYKWFLYSIVFLNTFVFPLLVSLVLYYRKMISSFQMEIRSERVIPFGFSMIFYFFTYYLIRQTAVPSVLISLVFGWALAVFVLFLTTLKYKVSAHTTGIGGLFGALVAIFIQFQADYAKVIILVALLWGIISYARLKLLAHSHGEVYSGSLVGFGSVFFAVFFGWGL